MHAAASTAGKRRLTRRERAGECERRIPSDEARIEEGIRLPYRSTADAGAARSSLWPIFTAPLGPHHGCCRTSS